jgi:hypothetical protein
MGRSSSSYASNKFVLSQQGYIRYKLSPGRLSSRRYPIVDTPNCLRRISRAPKGVSPKRAIDPAQTDLLVITLT